jgi:hypothetical protein
LLAVWIALIWPATLTVAEPAWAQARVEVAPAVGTVEARLIGSASWPPERTVIVRDWLEAPGTDRVQVSVEELGPVFEAYASPRRR